MLDDLGPYPIGKFICINYWYICTTLFDLHRDASNTGTLSLIRDGIKCSCIYYFLFLSGASANLTWIWILSLLWVGTLSLCNIHPDRTLQSGPHNLYCSFLNYFCFIAAANVINVEPELEGSTISHIKHSWYKYLHPFLFHYWDRLSLRSENMEVVFVEDVWPFPYWITWEPLLSLIANLHWVYSWIDRFARYTISGSILLGNLL